ncbi:MAG: hypothetical protein ACO31I_03685 [Prochlorotrichaceae cyanobacterium]|jgi:tetratricopeptide (TPR) repeat protein
MVTNSSPPPQRTTREWFAFGQKALEQGFPIDAIAAFQAALEQGYPQSYLGGEIQIWLATAYEAAGQHQAALDRCRQLRSHPHASIRKQSADILYIWEAPALQTRPDWVVNIPDLSRVEDNPAPTVGAGVNRQKQRPKKEPVEPQIDPASINRKDNQFVWVGLGFLTIAWLIWTQFSP